MRHTENYGFPLYDPDASPDLTETGEHDRAIVDIDAAIKAEETARGEGDTALGARIDTEAAERKEADTAIYASLNRRPRASAIKLADGERYLTLSADEGDGTDAHQARVTIGSDLGTLEGEISANSADLTGIKGLTYGADDVHLVEESNGEYTSPALTEIEHDIADARQWQNVQGKPFTQLGSSMKSENGYLDVKQVGWDKVTDKPFSAVGSGLAVAADGTLSATARDYTLPAATTATLGGIKVGSGLAVAADGTLSATARDYTLPAATTLDLGGVKVGSGLSVTADGKISPVPLLTMTWEEIKAAAVGGIA